MRTASHWFDHYAESHQNGINKLIHWVCIPVILVSTLGLFAAIPHPFGSLFGDPPMLNWATVVVALSLLFYFRLSWTLGVGMLFVGGGALAINHAIVQAGLPLIWVSVGAFGVAWVAQFIGHKIEGKKPSFLTDLQFLLVGPAWLLQFIYKKVGVPVETYRASASAA